MMVFHSSIIRKSFLGTLTGTGAGSGAGKGVLLELFSLQILVKVLNIAKNNGSINIKNINGFPWFLGIFGWIV